MTMYNPPHPGEALRLDVLPALGISLDALAAHLGYSARRLHQVINCHAPIRAERGRRGFSYFIHKEYRMKKLFFSLFAALLLSTSNMAAAACAYMNITSSVASLSAGDSQNVYEFSISCIGSVTFKFEDLSGNNPTSRIAHIIERRSGSSWSLVSSTTSNGARTVNRSFVPSATGQYRYRIENVGTSQVRNWRMEGRMPLFTIPGT